MGKSTSRRTGETRRKGDQEGESEGEVGPRMTQRERGGKEGRKMAISEETRSS
jgi:hypothetical protein